MEANVLLLLFAHRMVVSEQFVGPLIPLPSGRGALYIHLAYILTNYILTN